MHEPSHGWSGVDHPIFCGDGPRTARLFIATDDDHDGNYEKTVRTKNPWSRKEYPYDVWATKLDPTIIVDPH